MSRLASLFCPVTNFHTLLYCYGANSQNPEHVQRGKTLLQSELWAFHYNYCTNIVTSVCTELYKK